MPATSWIQQMIDEVYHEINDPSSAYYGPKFVVANHYDPYTGIPPQPGGFGWNFGQMTQPEFVSAASSICPTIGASDSSKCLGYTTSAVPPNYPKLNLTAVSITGFSNVVLKEPQLQPDGVTLVTTADFSTLPPSSGYPAKVVIAGQFALTVYCCCPPANSPTSPCEANAPIDPQTGQGTFTATIPSCSATVTCTINNLNNPGVIPTLTADSFNFLVPTNSQTHGPNMSIDVKITNVPPDQQSGWNQQAMKVFNDPKALASILNTLIATMNQPGDLAVLANILTTQLDNYLRAHGLYPYPAAAARIF
ncbi:MAG: hypothetical protein JO108_00045 [Acidobacteriaceae bacterium]|nr:hypothetical protein [Acidobacteriaceae bacterium]